MSLNKLLFLVFFFILISCEEVINEVNISNEKVELLAPSDNVTLNTNEAISFNWQAVADAENYNLQIARPNFNTTVQLELDTILSRTDFRLDSLKANDYEWRVQGLNSVYQTNYSTNTFKVAKP